MRLSMVVVLLMCQLSLSLIWLLQPEQRSAYEQFVRNSGSFQPAASIEVLDEVGSDA